MANGVTLHDGETIVSDMLLSKWWTLSRYIVTFGFWGMWRKRHRFILTNQRLILTKGIVKRSEEVVPLSRIQDATLSRSPFSGGLIKLSSAGGALGFEKIGPLTQGDAKVFSHHLNDQMIKSQRPGFGL